MPSPFKPGVDPTRTGVLGFDRGTGGDRAREPAVGELDGQAIGAHDALTHEDLVPDGDVQFAAHRRGVLGYACHTVNPGADRYGVTDLEEFGRHATPRVSTRQVFTLSDRTGRRPDEVADGYLSYVATRRHRLGAYRGGSSGYDDESRAFAAVYFQQLGLAVQPFEVLIFCGGSRER